MPDERICGCKGIRTCLLCEKGNGLSAEPLQTEADETVYTYCPHCNLCWSNDETASPLFLGKLNLFLDFLSEEEQQYAISDIDGIQWMPSQSGRRKQDFGPKVNFKKKKVKIGNFKGFPKFTDYIIKRLQNMSGLEDFLPVELCHLEYSPERGSSIDPHVDDVWLWGERLVTINLGSSTVLTLTPCSKGPCECELESQFSHFCNSKKGRNNSSCDHKLANTIDVSSKSVTIPDRRVSEEDQFNDNTYSFQNGERKSGQYSHDSPDCQCTISTNQQCSCSKLLIVHPSECHNESDTRIETMCSVFRTAESKSKAEVRIVLPPRSLFVLAGCARYNWSHEIKRRDVVSRRLAMTFRELTAEFLDGGRENRFGKELLLIANNFIDL